MASFRKRGSGGWQAQVRRKGYPPQSKSFFTRAPAEWLKPSNQARVREFFRDLSEDETVEPPTAGPGCQIGIE